MTDDPTETEDLVEAADRTLERITAPWSGTPGGGGGGNVVINGRTAVHAGSGGVLTTTDVCKAGSKCRAVAFTNTARSEDAAGTAATVFVNGHPVCTRASRFATSSGDEGGNCGGVRSGTIKGAATFVTSSPDVFIEGVPVVRQHDLMVSNSGNTPPAPLQQPGAEAPEGLGLEGARGAEEAPPAHWVGVEIWARWPGKGAGRGLHAARALLYAEPAEGERSRVGLAALGAARDDDGRQLVAAGVEAGAHHLWLMTPAEDGPAVLAPLARGVEPAAGDTAPPSWDTALVPVLPLVHTGPEADPGNAALPGEGWLYVFVDGRLWREFAVRPRAGACVLREVDLGRHLLENHRPATGIGDPVLLLPARLAGRVPRVHVLYSHVQLSWIQLMKLGGLAPDDPRWDERRPAQAPGEDQKQALARRAVRVPLPASPGALPAQGPLVDVARVPRNGYTAPYAGTGVPALPLPDPFGVAHRRAAALSEAWAGMDALLRALATGVAPGTEGEPDPAVGDQFAMAALLHRLAWSDPELEERYGAHLNRDLLHLVLGREERARARQRIARAREALRAVLDGEAYQGVLWDFAAHSDPAVRLEGKCWLAFHHRLLALAPEARDAHLDPPREGAAGADPALDYLARVLREENAAGGLLMQAVELHSDMRTAPDLLARWGDALTALVDAFAALPKQDLAFLPRLGRIIASVEGPGWSLRAEVEYAHVSQPPPGRGWRTVPGAVRTEIVELADHGRAIRAASDSPAAARALAAAGTLPAEGVSRAVSGPVRLAVAMAGFDPAAPGPARARVLVENVKSLVVRDRTGARLAEAIKQSPLYDKGLTGLLGVVELLNLQLAVRQAAESGASARDVLAVSEAVLGAASYGAGLLERHYEARGIESRMMTARVWAARLGAGAWWLTAGLCVVDAVTNLRESDEDAATAYFLGFGAAVSAGGFTYAMASGVTLGLAVGLLASVVLFVAFMVAAAHLEDDPLERFVKNGPFRAEAPLPEGADPWARIRAAAADPRPSEALARWRDLSLARRDLMDILWGFQVELGVSMEVSPRSTLLASVRRARSVQAVVHLRHFRRFHSELESRLRVYPQGVGGRYVELEPVEVDYVSDEATGGVRRIVLRYVLPEVVKDALGERADVLFLARVRTRAVAGGDDRQVPAVTSDGELRYVGRLEPAGYGHATVGVGGSVLAQLPPRLLAQELWGKGRRVGTLAELTRPGSWKEA